MTFLFGTKENQVRNIFISIAILIAACLSALWVNLGN